MKKILTAILMAAVLLTSVLAFTACGGGSSEAVLKVIDIPLTNEEYAFAVAKGDAELLASVNSFLAEIKANGKFDEIVNKYFGDGTPTGVTSAAEDASKDQLVVATNAAFAPFEYKEGDTYYGIDMEIMAALAESLGKELVISNMEFESVCTAVAEGMCDVAAAGLTVNETRKQILDFSDSYYNASQVVITKADDTTFDACKTVEDVEAILSALTAEDKVGVQTGTTGQFYVAGDADWGFAGFPCECVGYEVGALAAQNILNGNVKYVVIDIAPAKAIVENTNALN
ncbi:MAG: transporter substrate-binding domain-containing protein [Ruminococcaceae bacterium]|nr:transporter substrate-binding domain-containing protein [Oscillospiraceae bacterium]